ncbi:MAG: sulfite exporter TauE/SafE family protein [Gemmatimonadaceae bacterium]|nr:sulfite exporter TauE/SafE family protein [Gemmatimonadaceae bacterium]
MDSTLLVIIGLAAGVLAGLFGVGGGIVIVPALVYFARLPMQTAIGTSLGALLLPVGALGAWSYFRNGHLQWKSSLWVALGLFFGAWLGAQLAQSLTDVTLRRLFAVLLVGAAVKMWIA